MKPIYLSLILLFTTAASDSGESPPAASDRNDPPRQRTDPRRGPTSRPAPRDSESTVPPATSQRTGDDEIRRWIRQLGHPTYQKREAAQAALARLGPKALPYLVEFIDSPDPEIANRIVSLIQRPDDPALRVLIAVRLLSTADPDRMEPAVYMLFEEPLIDYDLFVACTKDATGLQQAIFEPIVQQLAEWKQSTKQHLARRMNHFRNQRIEVAAKELELHQGSTIYQAEAAYWQAVGAVEEFEIDNHQKQTSTSRPAAETNPDVQRHP